MCYTYIVFYSYSAKFPSEVRLLARREGQRLKLLHLYRILLEESDKQHPLSTSELIDRLAKLDIPSERKSIYTDLELLCDFGVDIVRAPARGGYYIGSRDFELPELKLLVDAVQSSKFITEKQSDQLIAKLERLASRHDRGTLQRQVFVRGRIKSMNESIYYNVDELHAAITAGKKIRFSYFHYKLDFSAKNKLKKEYRKQDYITSPFALHRDDENYYLIAFDDDRIKHYRVDKMENITVLDQGRDGAESYAAFDTAAYSKRVFGMFSGEPRDVTLRFDNALIGVVVDRFGKDVFLAPADDSHFTVHVKVVISPQFFSWLAGFGDGVKLLSPADAAEEYKNTIQQIVNLY